MPKEKERGIGHFPVFKMNFRIHIFCLLITLTCGTEAKEQPRRLPHAIAVVGRTFEYFLPSQDASQHQYKVLVGTYEINWRDNAFF